MKTEVIGLGSGNARTIVEGFIRLINGRPTERVPVNRPTAPAEDPSPTEETTDPTPSTITFNGNQIEGYVVKQLQTSTGTKTVFIGKDGNIYTGQNDTGMQRFTPDYSTSPGSYPSPHSGGRVIFSAPYAYDPASGTKRGSVGLNLWDYGQLSTTIWLGSSGAGSNRIFNPKDQLSRATADRVINTDNVYGCITESGDDIKLVTGENGDLYIQIEGDTLYKFDGIRDRQIIDYNGTDKYGYFIFNHATANCKKQLFVSSDSFLYKIYNDEISRMSMTYSTTPPSFYPEGSGHGLVDEPYGFSGTGVPYGSTKVNIWDANSPISNRLSTNVVSGEPRNPGRGGIINIESLGRQSDMPVPVQGDVMFDGVSANGDPIKLVFGNDGQLYTLNGDQVYRHIEE